MGLERHGRRLWANTLGGPLLALEGHRLACWKGSDTEDYARACAVDDWVGTVPVSDGLGLVLGDEPAMTTALVRPDGVLFVRWHAADDLAAVDDGLAALAANDFPAELSYTISLNWSHPEIVLFDSVEPGASQTTFDLPPNRTIGDGALRLAVGPGTFLVRHGWLNRRIGSLSVVQLLRRGPS